MDNLNGFAVGNDTNRFDWNWKVLGSCRGVILKTTDGGENWFVEIGDLPGSLTALHSKDGYVWVVGENGLILKSNITTGNCINKKSKKIYHTRYTLNQNYPNPFNPVTMINYQLPMTNEVDLSIYNILGQKMVTLVHKKQTEGSYEVEWDASNLASGVYLYRIKAGDFVEIKKMVVMK